MARLVYSPCHVIEVDWQLLQLHSFSEERVHTHLLLIFFDAVPINTIILMVKYNDRSNTN